VHWGGVAASLALLSKEAVLFVPFAAVLLPLAGEPPAGGAPASALLITGVVFAPSTCFSAFTGSHGWIPYAMGFG
jgi:hypothetical protein